MESREKNKVKPVSRDWSPQDRLKPTPFLTVSDLSADVPHKLGTCSRNTHADLAVGKDNRFSGGQGTEAGGVSRQSATR